MPFLYVYSPSDFVGGLPDESGAQAAGSGSWTLELVDGAVPTLIEVSDDDLIFDEVDYNQTLVDGVNIDGTSYGSGTTIHSAYDLVNTGTGHQITSVHFGGSGYEQGAVHGIVSTIKLESGESYTFNQERTSHNQANYYDEFVACFADGTRIRTKRGDVAVEELKAGDMVATLDGGFQPLRLVLSRKLSQDVLETAPKLRPVRITAGSLGQGLPRHDLLVSPQHRMLASGPVCQRMFGQSDMLLAARKLTALPGIYVDPEIENVTYFHLVFDAHQVVFAENAPSESFYCGAQAMDGLAADAREELRQLFPELFAGQVLDMARYTPSDKAQKNFVTRLKSNGKMVLSAAA